jgi:hypothetical protein
MPKSILLGNFGRALINQLGNFMRALINQLSNMLLSPHFPWTSPPPPHIAWGSLLIFVLTADPPSPLIPRPERPTYPSSPFEHGILGCGLVAWKWPSGDITDGQTEVRVIMVVTSVHEKTGQWRKLHPKVQLFQCKEGGMLYWPAY